MSFVIGGAAGTALTPVALKLTDDSSIWSQNWPWTPVPLDGEINYADSACTLCPGGCGITVRKIDDRAVKIEGKEGHPVNDGGICPLGVSGLQLLYGPNRVKSPMKKVNGVHRKISWDDAITEVVEKLAKLREDGEPDAAACIAGSEGGTTPALMERLLKACGSLNFMPTPTMTDAYAMAMKIQQGQEAQPGFDLENADFILSFGAGVIDGWGSPVRMFRANAGWKEAGVEIAQVEPRQSNTAAKSDLWLPAKPGTEAALAMGVAHVLIQKSLYNATFVNARTAGFEKWKAHVLANYAPQKVAEITGVPAEKIVAAAVKFGKAKNPAAICGRGKGRAPGQVNEVMAVQALNALKGAINQKGGVFAVPFPATDWPEVEPDDAAQAGIGKGRLDGAGSDLYPNARSLPNRLPSVAKPGAVKLLFVMGANPFYSFSNGAALKEAVKDAYKVSFSSYMDETAMEADLILPNHVYLERWEDASTIAGLSKPAISLVQPVVDPQLDTMNTGDVIIRVAKDMGDAVAEAFPWDDYETCLQETMGEKWDALEEEGVWVDDSFEPPEGFDTASGKFEFTLNADGPSSDYTPVKLEGADGGLLLIPYDTIRLASDYIGDPPFLVKLLSNEILKENDGLVALNPATAKKFGLSECSTVEFTTGAGKAEVRVCLSHGVMPGVMAMPRGLGHTAFDEFLKDKGVNVNALIGVVEDPFTGLDAAWGVRAKLA
ncbi:MAG: molybdopterin-dependent oxidoreductase [Desulfobacterales bacterium]|nr:molybdopterin-dependent oxidoreductase [Desulfobacterales bacterium]